MMTDPIADMLTRVRNANAVGSETVSMPSSKMKERIAAILTAEGYIDGYDVAPAEPGRELSMRLKYGDRRSPVIKGIKRVSKPGHRIYRKSTDLPRALGGLGVVVVSTSQGLLTDSDARRRHLGGEVLCEVW